MICRSCGKVRDDSSNFCPFCGAASGSLVSRASASADDAGASASSASSSSSFDAGGAVLATPELPGYNYSAPEEERPFQGSDYLVGNAILLVLCCGFPTTIAGLIFSIMARSSKAGPDRQKAAMQATIAQVLFWISLALAVGSYAVGIWATISEDSDVDESIQQAVDCRLEEFGLSVGDQDDEDFDAAVMLNDRQADELRLAAIKAFEAAVDEKLREFGFELDEDADEELDPELEAAVKNAIDQLPDDLLDDLDDSASADADNK